MIVLVVSFFLLFFSSLTNTKESDFLFSFVGCCICVPFTKISIVLLHCSNMNAKNASINLFWFNCFRVVLRFTEQNGKIVSANDRQWVAFFFCLSLFFAHVLVFFFVVVKIGFFCLTSNKSRLISYKIWSAWRYLNWLWGASHAFARVTILSIRGIFFFRLNRFCKISTLQKWFVADANTLRKYNIR